MRSTERYWKQTMQLIFLLPSDVWSAALLVPSTSEEEKLLQSETTYTNNESSRLKTVVVSQHVIWTLPCMETVLSLLRSYGTPSQSSLPPGTVLLGGFQLSRTDSDHMMCWGLQLFSKAARAGRSLNLRIILDTGTLSGLWVHQVCCDGGDLADWSCGLLIISKAQLTIPKCWSSMPLCPSISHWYAGQPALCSFSPPKQNLPIPLVGFPNQRRKAVVTQSAWMAAEDRGREGISRKYLDSG